MNYIILSTPKHENIKDLINILLDQINQGDYEVKENYYIIEYVSANISGLELNDIIINYANEQLVDISAFISDAYAPLVSEVVSLLALTNHRDTVIYDRKTLFSDVLNVSNKPLIKRLVFKSYEKDFGMLNLLKVFIESDQNISLTAKLTFYHRNTIMQKLDRFAEITGFNVRKFKDAYLIYNLLK